MKFKLIFSFLIIFCSVASGQVKIRLFANLSPGSAVFSTIDGSYEMNPFNGEIITVSKGEPVILIKFNGKIAVKTRNEKGFICDSVLFSGKTGNDYFSLRINGGPLTKQYYSGDLQCFPDFGTLECINKTDIDKYIAGVVMAEGGAGKNLEFFKTQAIIAGHTCTKILISTLRISIIFVIIHIVRHLMVYLLIRFSMKQPLKQEALLFLIKTAS